MLCRPGPRSLGSIFLKFSSLKWHKTRQHVMIKTYHPLILWSSVPEHEFRGYNLRSPPLLEPKVALIF